MEIRNQITGLQHQMLTTGTGQVAKKEETQVVPQDQVQISGKEEGVHKKWLFLNYIGADCNLTQFQVANIDQQELVGSDANTHIVAYVDVGPKPSPMQCEKADGTTEQWQGCRAFYVTQNDKMGTLGSELIGQYGDHVDTSNPETLAKFVTDAVTRFPADHVALIFNDHGGGWTGAISDDTDGGFMSMPKIREGLEKAQEATGKKLDIIGFDACLMAGVEVADELKNVGNIMLAAQESEGGPGWTYNSMLGGNLGEAIKTTQNSLGKRINMSPYEFAKVVVNVNEQHSNDIPTFSATDLTKMDKLNNASENLAQAILKSTPEEKTAIKAAIQQSENYGGGWTPYSDMRDLHHLGRNIISSAAGEGLKEAAKGAIGAVEEVVFANEVNPAEHPESKGLHIYAPVTGSMGKDYKDLQFAKNSSWDEAIESLGIKYDPTMKSPNVWPDGSPRHEKKLN